MKIETGNLDVLRENDPERKGWVAGDFIDHQSLRYSNNCSIKWAYHPKGLRKTSGSGLNANTRTMVILISGVWLTRLLEDGREIILSNPGDYLIYENAKHENEAIEDSRVMVIRWKEK